MMSDTTPIYTADQYDVLRNRIDKLEKEKTSLFNENEELREACARLQTNQGFVKASDVSDQTLTAATSDASIITNAIMDIRKLIQKPGVKIRRIKTNITGGTIVEISYET